MYDVLLLILTAVICFVVSFAITFSGTTLFINWKRRTKKKYQFTEPAKIKGVRHNQVLDTNVPVGVDGSNALKEFTRK